MKREERIPLLEEMSDALTLREAENLSDADKRKRFLPLRVHTLALRPETVVVRGGRGAGKSALFNLILQSNDSSGIRELFRDGNRIPDAKWIDAFSQMGSIHPEASTVDRFAETHSDTELRTFWSAHLLKRLCEEIPDLNIDLPDALRTVFRNTNIETWFPTVTEYQGTIHAALDGINRSSEQDDTYIFAAYDHLDRIGAFDRTIRGRFSSALLALWLSLSNRYSRLRAKIFLREDLFEQAIQSFPDATKLRPRSVSIEWETASLYRVVVRHMANLSDKMHDWLRSVSGIEIDDRGVWGWMPEEMYEREQKTFAAKLAGDLMGKGMNKGYTYRWIPNRLQDAQVKIVPRSILCLLGFAAENAKRNPLSKGTRLIEPTDLFAGLEPTSKERVNEIAEEYSIVRRLENLKNRHVMMDPKEASALLGTPTLNDKNPQMTDGDAVIEELVGLGVLSIRPDGRIDVPDIYRYGFGIKRKGGVARPK